MPRSTSLLAAAAAALLSLAIGGCSSDDTTAQEESVTASSEAPAEGEVREGARFQLHPYLGYTYAPSQAGINTHGFASGGPEYPYDRRPTEFVVGVFGGARAEQIAAQSEQFRRVLLPTLRERGYDRVTVLPFAVEGWHDPQAFYAFLTYLSSVDLAVVVDGLNEATVLASESIDWPLEFPRRSTYSPLARLDAPLPGRTTPQEAGAYQTAWKDRLLAMDLIGFEQGKPFAHFVEPNPYALPGHEADPEGALVGPAYERVRGMVKLLAAEGVFSTFLGDLVSNADGTVYEADCCRLTGEGAVQLAATIAQEIELAGLTQDTPRAKDRVLPPPTPRRAPNPPASKAPRGSSAMSETSGRASGGAPGAPAGDGSDATGGNTSLPLLGSAQ